MNTKHRKVILTITLIYTALILFFMFIAFGRVDTEDRVTGYRFLFIPNDFFRLPDLSDLLHPTLMHAWAFGNIAAFIPFGILIPLLYRTGFIRFMILFILCILVLETVQALTLLGSFDINDVIQNSMGAAAGYGAFRIGYRTNKVWRNIAATGIAAIVLMLGIWGSCQVLDQAFTKKLGPFIALNELNTSEASLSKGTTRDSLQIGGQHVKPQYNVYSTEGKLTVTYTYPLNKRELYLYMNVGIPDQADARGSLRIAADGKEYLSVSGDGQNHQSEMDSTYIHGAKELTITLEGNMRMWDVGFREMRYIWNK